MIWFKRLLYRLTGHMWVCENDWVWCLKYGGGRVTYRSKNNFKVTYPLFAYATLSYNYAGVPINNLGPISEVRLKFIEDMPPEFAPQSIEVRDI